MATRVRRTVAQVRPRLEADMPSHTHRHTWVTIWVLRLQRTGTRLHLGRVEHHRAIRINGEDSMRSHSLLRARRRVRHHRRGRHMGGRHRWGTHSGRGRRRRVVGRVRARVREDKDRDRRDRVLAVGMLGIVGRRVRAWMVRTTEVARRHMVLLRMEVKMEATH
jgi:hypothetical protein